MKRVVFWTVALVLAAGSVWADTISGGTLTGFPAGFAATTGASGVQGSPFWNDYSMDGNQMNVGYFLTASGGLTSEPNRTPTQFLSDGTASAANAPLSFNFVRNTASLQIVLLGAFSSLNATTAGNLGTAVGIYDTSNPLSKTVLFASGTIPTSSGVAGSPAAFASPYASYGFYATVCFGPSASQCRTYYTQSALDQSAATGGAILEPAAHQHFAVFAANGLAANQESYYIGIEDGWGTTGSERLGDYQDIIFAISAITAVPEPGTFVFMGLGLVGVALAGRRLRKK